MSDSKRTDLAVRLGDRIRTLRETRDISQEDLAARAGIHHKAEKQVKAEDLPLFKGVTE